MLEKARVHANTVTKYNCLRKSFHSAKEQIKNHSDGMKDMHTELLDLRNLLEMTQEESMKTSYDFEQFKHVKVKEITSLRQDYELETSK